MFSPRLPLPPPRNVPWPLKPIESAQTSLSYDGFGRMVMHIQHDVLKGITPQMLAWWFTHIGGEVSIEGHRHTKYLVWHPHDHILWQLARPAPSGCAAVGAQFRIIEAFNRDPAFYVDVIDTVTRLDETGFTAVTRVLGIEVAQLNHDFIAVAGGTRYVSTLTVGIVLPLIGQYWNSLLHALKFPEPMGRAWLKHNIEEVGVLEHIVPLAQAQER